MLTDKRVYADQAATTALGEAAWRAMEPWLRTEFGNPSALYEEGRRARDCVESAREKTAKLLGAEPKEICFTSGGTEADNWAVYGAAKLGAKSGRRHLILSAFEHHAVLNPAKALEKEGFEITLLPVYENGIVHPKDLERAIRRDTALVSVMFANNEVGTIQPVEELGAVCREKGVLFHTDAVQAAGHLPIDLAVLPVDLLSLSAHKFHGPKGIGALYVRSGTDLDSLICGGGQERGKRAGTENVASAAGLAAALEDSLTDRTAKDAYVAELRSLVRDALLSVEKSRLNGDEAKRLPGNLNVSFQGIEAEALLVYLDMKKIAVSSGAACEAGALEPSHVLTAMGVTDSDAKGALRITLDETNTREEAQYLSHMIPEAVMRLREMS